MISLYVANNAWFAPVYLRARDGMIDYHTTYNAYIYTLALLYSAYCISYIDVLAVWLKSTMYLVG